MQSVENQVEKKGYSSRVICVACTNKHMQALRIEMKLLWSRLKGFADVDDGIPEKPIVWSRWGIRNMVQERAMSSAANVIVTIHLNDVSITCEQLLCMLNPQKA